MKCSKFFGLLLMGSLSVVPASALELQQLWEVTLPEGQTYIRANITWSPSDSLPHLFVMGREDFIVYHMTPGSEFEPILTLPDYPSGEIQCFGACLDSTWESSVLVHFRYVASDSVGRVQIVNLVTGDSIRAADVTTRITFDLLYQEERNMWWHPNTLFCSGAKNGMGTYLSGPYYDHHYYYTMFTTSGGYTNGSKMVGWNARDLASMCNCTAFRLGSQAYCLLGNDSLPDFVCSGQTWGFWELHDWDNDWGYWFDYYGAKIYFCREGTSTYVNNTTQGTVMALERADGPAWGFLFSWNDSLAYWVRGPSQNWARRSSISNPALSAAFPHRLVPQRIALVYSATTLTEIDLLDGHAVESTQVPPNIRMLQPYLAEDGSWELMAVFERSVRGYRVTGLLPAKDAKPVLPQLYSLQTYPNPFNEAVKIAYELPRTERARVHVMDVLGREVTVLSDEMSTAGRHELIWNPTNLASGIYFLCLRTENASRVNKLVYLK